MIVVSFDKELREAFAAGEAAAMSRFLQNRKGAEQFMTAIPKTYEEWIESMSDRPSVVRG